MRNDPGRTGADATGKVKTNATNVPAHVPSQDSIDIALTAAGFAIDIRDAVRRLDELLNGAAP
jgi:hypothetical protein